MDLNFKAGLPLMFEGASGIGKTDLAEQYAEDQNAPEIVRDKGEFCLCEINLALASLPDLIGLQHFVTEDYVDASGANVAIETAAFAYPYFMRDKKTRRPAFTYQRGVVVLEEYGQGQGDVKRASAQIIQKGQAGQHSFPKGWNVLVLSNRPEDRSGVGKDFDFLINRRAQMQLKAELDGWLVWAHERQISNMSMAFASRNTDKVFSNKAPEKQGPWLTPRSLANADAFIHVAIDDGLSLDDDLMRQNLAALIGDGNAHVYIAFAKIRDNLPRFSDIVADPSGTKVPAEPDQMMFLSFDLASKATRANIKALVTYMGRMPNDFAIAFYRSAIHRDPTLRSTKEFGDWAVANLALLAAVNS